MTRIQSSVVVLAALALPLSAWAQETNDGWGGRAYVSINAGAQIQSPSFGYAYATRLWDETARAGLDIPGRTGAAFDVGGGVRLLQNLGVGLAYSRYTKTRTATLSTTIPSPYFYDAASTAERQIPLRREENAIHIQAIYRRPLADRLQVGLFGGPTYFRCRDDLVSQFALESDVVLPSYDWTVDFRRVTQSVDRGPMWGVHGGGDVTYLLTRYMGVGTTVRVSRASHHAVNHFSSTDRLEAEGIWGAGEPQGEVTMSHGGLQWTGGLSFRF